MYLKEIKIFGFKSFADKINIELGKNLNGVVGPNGSGKSNIVDAVRWVLGEQSIKSLRGDSSLDVIFSGSKTRRPLNSASVCLVFNNEDRVIPLDFNEVSIKRVLYRTGENEYFINNERCRLKDITELLTDTGGSKESFNIISQGKIDEIISTKASDRRVIFEEAANVLKYKRRKEEALRKLERTNDNLNRINDIILELKTTLDPLEIEKNKALSYISAKDELKEIEISLIASDIEKSNYEYNDLKDKITKLEDEIFELSKNNTNYDIIIINEKDDLKKIEEEINDKRNILLTKVRELESIKKDIDLLLERNKYLNKSNDIDDKIFKLKDSLNKLKNDYASINNDNLINIKKKDNINDDLNKNINNLNIIKDKEFKLTNNLNKYNIEENRLKYKIEQLENNISNNGSLPSSIKQILSNPLFTGIHNVIGKLIDVDEEYVDCINTSLMGASNYLVVDNKNIATRLVNYLKENKLGRATFFPLDVITARNIDNEIIDRIKYEEGYIDIASNLVKYDIKYDNIIKNQLGNIIVCKDIECANRISNIINKKYKIVTLDGQIVNVGGSISGGSKVNINNSIKEKYELEENKRNYIKVIEDIKNITKELKEISINKKGLEDNIFSLKVKLNEIDDLINLKNKNINNINNEIIIKEKELNDLESISLNKTDSEEKRLLDISLNIQNEINNIEKDINFLNIDKSNKEKSIIELEELSKGSNTNINRLEKEKSSYEIKVNRLEVTIDNLLLDLNEEYNITYDYAKENYMLDIDEELARKKVVSLKNKLKELGVVNLGSPQEFERINERYTYLNNQKTDLEEAEVTLVNIIHEMDDIMKDKFITTFEKIQVEFKKVFKDLFKGGHADLILTDPNNLLETGVEIIAEPPGKKLQNISLLSGGEKTFTAISLLFAILNVRPVPFCLLDEVEAALDDANVESFGEYLKNYNDTQFVLITHKKKTMEFINILYGITMQESGVSKLVSVKLEELNKKE